MRKIFCLLTIILFLSSAAFSLEPYHSARNNCLDPNWLLKQTEIPPSLIHTKALKVHGRGAQRSVYDYDGGILRILPLQDADEIKAFCKIMNFQTLPGVVKIRHLYRLDSNSIAVVFEKLNKLELGTVSSQEFASMCLELAETLRAIHYAGFKHGDISNTNLMMRGKHFVLIDFATRGTSLSGNDSEDMARMILAARQRPVYQHKIADLVVQVYKLIDQPNESFLSRFYNSLDLPETRAFFWSFAPHLYGVALKHRTSCPNALQKKGNELLYDSDCINFQWRYEFPAVIYEYNKLAIQKLREIRSGKQVCHEHDSEGQMYCAHNDAERDLKGEYGSLRNFASSVMLNLGRTETLLYKLYLDENLDDFIKNVKAEEAAVLTRISHE